MDLQMFMHREREGVLREYAIEKGAAGLPLAAVSSLDLIIENRSTPLKAVAPVHVVPLPENPGHAWAQLCPALDYASLWVDVNSQTYRQDYGHFLRTFGGVTLPSISASLHVDHLFNAARARRSGLLYVRTALVPRLVNISHGGGYERSITASEALRDRRGSRKMDEITHMKFHGFRPGEVDAYAAYLAARCGLDAAEVRATIGFLVDKARSGWAAT